MAKGEHSLHPIGSGAPLDERPEPSGPLAWLRRLFRSGNGEETAREALTELIEEREDREDADLPIDADQKILLANILDLKGRTIDDVMVPRADITAVEQGADLAEIIDLMTKEGHSRLPVYRDTLDDTLGMVHIKDVIAWRGEDASFSLADILRKILFVSPSMQVLELLLEMRVTRRHMALVVDEFGGIDGLVTIEDLVEEIVGEIEDEHDRSEMPDLARESDGTICADARTTIDALEKLMGPFVTEAEREEVDTLGGLAFLLAGHVPIRGELVTHSSGVEFEVLDADPRRIKRLRVRGKAGRRPSSQTGPDGS